MNASMQGPLGYIFTPPFSSPSFSSCRTGFAAGWLSEQESLEYVRRAAMASQPAYSGWDDVAEAVIVGAVEWNRDVGGNPMSDDAVRQRRARTQGARAKIWPSTPFKAAMG